MNNCGLTEEKVAAWVDKHFPDAKVRRDGNERVINNPFDGDTGYHFNISLDRFACHDWRGDEWRGREKDGRASKGSFITFVRRYLGCTYREAIQSVLGEDSRFLLPKRRKIEIAEPEAEIELPLGAIRLSTSPYHKQALLLMNWLESRGVGAEDVKRYDLHHVGSSVVWPYHEYGVLTYWQSRSRLNKKFLFPSLVPGGKGKGDFLYGFDDVEPARHLVLTEAIFDKLSLREQAAATGGAILTKSQLNLVKVIGPRDGVILAPDNDEAGIQSIVSNGKTLLDRGYKVFYSIPPKLPYVVDGVSCITKDWNELGQYVIGWDEVPKLMEKGIKKLSQFDLIKLRLRTT